MLLIIKYDYHRTYLRYRIPKGAYIYVTGPEKTGLIYAKHTHSYNGAYLFLCSCYLISISFVELLRIFCIHDEICVMILYCQVEIMHFKD